MKSAQAITTTNRRHRSQRVATNSQTRATRLARRVGFTLVELLIVIVIIGILISMLVVAVNPVIRTARETTIAIEMKQIDLAIENFNNKYGFYPPSFTGFDKTNGAADAAQLLPFLNKISPNHRETTSIPGFASGLSRLQVWWLAIGRNLDDRSSLVFWLNGLGQNKQFPITGNLPVVGANAQLPVIFSADLSIQVSVASLGSNPVAVAINGNNEFPFPVGTVFERESQFDFLGAQLDADGGPAGIRIYNSPHGDAKGDLAYRYRNAGPNQSFYGDPQNTGGIAYHVNTDGGPVYLNPNTFQLSTFGLDGQVAPFAPASINQPTRSHQDMPTTEQLADWKKFSSDNIANFATGRLDGFDWTEAVELGGRNPQ